MVYQQERVTQLLENYAAIGPVGNFGAMMLGRDLKAASEAVASGDIVAMLRAYEALKGCK